MSQPAYERVVLVFHFHCTSTLSITTFSSLTSCTTSPEYGETPCWTRERPSWTEKEKKKHQTSCYGIKNIMSRFSKHFHALSHKIGRNRHGQCIPPSQWGTPQVSAVQALKPVTFWRPKSVIFQILLQTWAQNKYLIHTSRADHRPDRY